MSKLTKIQALRAQAEVALHSKRNFIGVGAATYKALVEVAVQAERSLSLKGDSQQAVDDDRIDQRELLGVRIDELSDVL